MHEKLLALAVALAACSDEDGADRGALDGTWTGTAAGFRVTADVEMTYANGGTFVVQGVMSTDRPTCFTSAMLAGTQSRTSINLIATGNGTSSSTTYVRVFGELAGDTITGTLEVTASLDECQVASAPIVLAR